MQREEFKNWLVNDYKNGEGMSEGSADNRISNAQKVENIFGDFDELYDQNRLEDILDLLKYSVDDEKSCKELPKGLQIDGNKYDGMATLRQAVKRYLEFKNFKSK